MVTFGDVLYSEVHSWTKWGHDSCVSRGRVNIWAHIFSDGGVTWATDHLPERGITPAGWDVFIDVHTATNWMNELNWPENFVFCTLSCQFWQSPFNNNNGKSFLYFLFFCFSNANIRTSHRGSVCVVKCSFTFKRSLPLHGTLGPILHDQS